MISDGAFCMWFLHPPMWWVKDKQKREPAGHRAAPLSSRNTFSRGDREHQIMLACLQGDIFPSYCCFLSVGKPAPFCFNSGTHSGRISSSYKRAQSQKPSRIRYNKMSRGRGFREICGPLKWTTRAPSIFPSWPPADFSPRAASSLPGYRQEDAGKDTIGRGCLCCWRLLFPQTSSCLIDQN